MTGTNKYRPKLDAMLERKEEGDAVVIESLSRLGRSAEDVLSLIDLPKEKGVKLVSLKENINTETGTE